jgi:hypothetical protein
MGNIPHVSISLHEFDEMRNKIKNQEEKIAELEGNIKEVKITIERNIEKVPSDIQKEYYAMLEMEPPTQYERITDVKFMKMEDLIKTLEAQILSQSPDKYTEVIEAKNRMIKNINEREEYLKATFEGEFKDRIRNLEEKNNELYQVNSDLAQKLENYENTPVKTTTKTWWSKIFS